MDSMSYLPSKFFVCKTVALSLKGRYWVETIKFESAFAIYTIHRHVVHPGGPFVVFLHGGPGLNNEVERQVLAPKFAQSHNMLWFDFLGCHNSPAFDRSHINLENTLTDMKAILDSFTFDEVYLVGFCIGTQFIHHFAQKYPEMVKEKVKKVAFMGPAIKTAGVLKNILKIHKDRGSLKLDDADQAVFATVQSADDVSMTPTQLEKCASLIFKAENFPEIYWFNKEAMNNYFRVNLDKPISVDVFFNVQNDLFAKNIDRLEELYAELYQDSEVLLLQGEHDRITVWEQNGQILQQKIPHAKFETVKNAGHWVHLENAPQVVSTLQKFFDEEKLTSKLQPGSYSQDSAHHAFQESL